MEGGVPVACFPGTLGRRSGWGLQQEMANNTSCGPRSSPFHPETVGCFNSDLVSPAADQIPPNVFQHLHCVAKNLGIGCGSEVECFPSVFEGWNSNPSTMMRQDKAVRAALKVYGSEPRPVCAQYSLPMPTLALRLHHAMPPMLHCIFQLLV